MNLCAHIAGEVDRNPGKIAFRFLDTQMGLSDCLSFEELWLRSGFFQAKFETMGLAGQRVLLAFKSGYHFISVFLGCLRAGVVAVPVSVPRPRESGRRWRMFADDCQAKLGLTDCERVCGLKRPGFNWQLMTVGGRSEVDPVITKALAYLQYTSGSTSEPKGVRVTHENLMASLAYYESDIGHHHARVFVNWLPHFHDLGLVQGYLQPLFSGSEAVILSSWAFLQRPARWLKAISKFGGTEASSPNFGFQLCVEKVKEETIPTLDLSSWRYATSAAEPVRYETCRRFTEKFSRCGLRKEALRVGYGLAEATLKVSASTPDAPIHFVCLCRKSLGKGFAKERGDAHTILVASCGEPRAEYVSVVIVEPETGRVLPEGSIGEAWIRGAIVCEDYWNPKPGVFHAEASDGKEYVRTGDLGFFKGGELFVCGRLNDLIIRNGVNYYPADIEHSVRNLHPAFSGVVRGAVVQSADGEICLLQEVRRTWLTSLDIGRQEVAIKRCVSTEHGLALDRVILVIPGSISRTSSGKTQRGLSRKMLAEDRVTTVSSYLVNRST